MKSVKKDVRILLLTKKRFTFAAIIQKLHLFFTGIDIVSLYQVRWKRND